MTSNSRHKASGGHTELQHFVCGLLGGLMVGPRQKVSNRAIDDEYGELN